MSILYDLLFAVLDVNTCVTIQMWLFKRCVALYHLAICLIDCTFLPAVLSWLDKIRYRRTKGTQISPRRFLFNLELLKHVFRIANSTQIITRSVSNAPTFSECLPMNIKLNDMFYDRCDIANIIMCCCFRSSRYSWVCVAARKSTNWTLLSRQDTADAF